MSPASPQRIEAIVATDDCKWFGAGETKANAVNYVSLVAHFGEMHVIVGPSGSGKTTFLSIISGIRMLNSATVLVNGSNLWIVNTN